jgi:hypothetical protein
MEAYLRKFLHIIKTFSIVLLLITSTKHFVLSYLIPSNTLTIFVLLIMHDAASTSFLNLGGLQLLEQYILLSLQFA